MIKAYMVNDCSCNREHRAKACFWPLPSAAKLGRIQIVRYVGLEKAATLNAVEGFMTDAMDSLFRGQNVVDWAVSSEVVKGGVA